MIGVPGDSISYINKILYINGKKAEQKFLSYSTDSNGGEKSWKVGIYEENLNGIKHKIYRRPDVLPVNFNNLIVPKGQYFMMGDNRDNSDDSRYWGFVPENDYIGRAFMVWLSWNAEAKHWYEKIRWNRFGTSL